MNYSSSLNDIQDPLILDTSVLINLQACKYGECILKSIKNDILISELVFRELEHETSIKNGNHDFLTNLVARGAVNITHMTELEYDIFNELTSTAPSLQDGEAATLAISVARRVIPVIDEKKGARVVVFY